MFRNFKIAEISASSSSKGRGWIAEKKLVPGASIHQEEPLIKVIDLNKVPIYCASCLMSIFDLSLENIKLNQCTRCKSIRYCSRDCQAKDWPIHQLECPCLVEHQKKRSEIPPTFIRLVARLMIKKQLNPNDYQTFMDRLISNRQLFSSEQFEQFVPTIILLRTYLEPAKLKIQLPEGQDLMEICCKISCNGLGLHNIRSMDPAGTALCNQISMINHSCNPNATVLYDKDKLYVKAIQSIEKGQEITINYVDLAMSRRKRQKSLRQQYFFDCNCDLCVKYENVHDPRGAYKCPNPSCTAQFEAPELTNEQMKGPINIECESCKSIHLNFENTIQKHKKAQEKMEKSDRLFAENKSNQSSHHQTAFLRSVKLAGSAHKEMASILGPLHQDLLDAKQKIMEFLTFSGNAKEAAEVQVELAKAYDQLFPSLHPWVCYGFAQAAKMCMSQIYTSRQLYPPTEGMIKEAVRRVSITYGNSSWITRDALDTQNAYCLASRNNGEILLL